MPSGRPWYQRNPADFIMGTRDLTLEERGAYSELIDHLNERDRPLPDDDRFIAGLLCCPVQRWKKIRAVLIEKGKIVLTHDGHFTNERFEREHAARFRTREEAVEHGRAGGLISAAKRAGQTELDLPPHPRAHARTESAKSSNKVATKLEESSNLVGTDPELPHQETEQIQHSGPTPPSSSVRARESRDQSKSLYPTHPINGGTHVRAGESLAGASLKTLFDHVCEAAGFCPTDPEQIDRAFATIEQWRDLGFDFDQTVLPSIRAEVLGTDHPTRVLNRYTKRIRHEHAKLAAARARGQPDTKPEIPNLSPEGEDPALFPLRTSLLERVGDRLYCLAFNTVRFETVNDPLAEKQPLRVCGPEYAISSLTSGTEWARILAATARTHGFTEIWK